MTAHELAKKLLDGPDLPVTVTDWDEYGYRIYYTVKEIAELPEKDWQDGKGQHINIGSGL